MKHLKTFESTQFYDKTGVFIEPVASSSDFLSFIDHNEDTLGFNGEEFFDNMEMWEEGNISSRFSVDWCKKVIAGEAGDYWKKKMKYYPAILLLLETYELETIRFACDW